MNWVTHPPVTPNTCAVIPGRGASMEPRGFLDTYNELPGIDPHVYISYAGCEQVAKEIGWAPPEELNTAQEQVRALAEQAEELRVQLQEAEDALGAIDVIESKDFRARKRPGRKPKTPVEA